MSDKVVLRNAKEFTSCRSSEGQTVLYHSTSRLCEEMARDMSPFQNPEHLNGINFITLHNASYFHCDVMHFLYHCSRGECFPMQHWELYIAEVSKSPLSAWYHLHCSPC